MHKAAIFFSKGLQLKIGAQKLKTSSYWFLFSIYRPTLSTPFAHCSISSLQAARYIKERKYFTTEISLFRPLLLQPFLPRVHWQKVFTVVLMRIRNFHRKKGLCSWCIRPLYIFLTVLARTITFSQHAGTPRQLESIFLILSPARKNLVSSIVSTTACLISFESRMNDQLFAEKREMISFLIALLWITLLLS